MYLLLVMSRAYMNFYFPENQAEVERIVKLACKHNVVIIPFGGQFSTFIMNISATALATYIVKFLTRCLCG